MLCSIQEIVCPSQCGPRILSEPASFVTARHVVMQPA